MHDCAYDAVVVGHVFLEVASCDLPLAVCYEQLVSSAKNCNPTEAVCTFSVLRFVVQIFGFRMLKVFLARLRV